MTHACQNKGCQAWQADCLSQARQCIANGMRGHGMPKEGWPGMASKGQGNGQGMTQGMPKEGVAKAWQADCMSPGKAMHCSWHANSKGGQGMTHARIACHRQGNDSRHAKRGWPSGKMACHRAGALACQTKVCPRHDSRHAKKGWARHGKLIACHRAGQCIGCQDQGRPRHDSRPIEGLAKAWQAMMSRARQCMPKQGVPTAWQADCFTGQGNHCHWPRQGMTHGMTKQEFMASQFLAPGKEFIATAFETKGWHDKARWQADCLSPIKSMHCSRHAKTKGGQGMTGMASRLLVTGQGIFYSRHAKKRGGQGMARRGMPRPRVAKPWQASCWVPSRWVMLGIGNQVAG
ncbi:hypothetical protein RHGRI_010874 [Rhododendron griersonianum]|uniref:Uncharacterized protein n=1 Tax=Rhododendron griersonianum TaxID=479676 RepID=A0AAV6KKM4_9ERIC|nr:hypothetical protein RHGRI_010874 [Rhododendron griersonianum]